MIGLAHFATNIGLLIGLLIVAGLAFVFLIVALTSINLLRRHWTEQAAREMWQKERIGPDGKPFPPSDRGFCDRCGLPHEKVYHMPDGSRLCLRHYEETLTLRVPRTQQPEET